MFGLTNTALWWHQCNEAMNNSVLYYRLDKMHQVPKLGKKTPIVLIISSPKKTHGCLIYGLDLFDTASQTLKDRLHKLFLECPAADRSSYEKSTSEVQRLLQIVEEVLHDIIALCQRSSYSLNLQQREVCVLVYSITSQVVFNNLMYLSTNVKFFILFFSPRVCVRLCVQTLWFYLLEAMMSPQKLLKSPDDRHISKSEIQTHTNSNFDLTLFTLSRSPNIFSFPSTKRAHHGCLKQNVQFYCTTCYHSTYPTGEQFMLLLQTDN